MTCERMHTQTLRQADAMDAEETGEVVTWSTGKRSGTITTPCGLTLDAAGRCEVCDEASE